MKLIKCLILASIILIQKDTLSKVNILSENIALNDQRQYQQAIYEVNQAVKRYSTQGICQGTKLVKSCGNKICEEKNNENADTCPADCLKGEIRSYNHQTICDEVQTIHSPSNAQEVREAVEYARSYGLKIRVVGAKHSANDQLCNNGMIVSTKNLNKIHKVEDFLGEKTVLVDAGVTIGELSKWLHEKNLSLGYTLIGYRGVTIAGSTATGSHGSSVKHPSVMASLIRSIKLVTADGKIKEFHRSNTRKQKWKALKTSLGMMGIITQLRLKVFPQFNLRVKVNYENESVMFKPNGMLNLVKDCDWGQINWFPGTKKIMKSCGYKTTEPAEKGASNTLLMPDIPDFIVRPFKSILQYGACFKSLNCLIENVRYLQFKVSPPFKKENKRGKLVSSKDLVGPSHMMTSSAFTKKADGFFQMDWELAVPASEIHNAMMTVKKHIDDNNICLPLVGVFIRFTKIEDTTLLAHSSHGGPFKKGETVAFIEMPVYLPVGFDKEKIKKYDWMYEEFAKLLMDKHGARPHWGKNRDWIFKKGFEMKVYGKNFSDFAKTVKQMDPEEMFSNKWSEVIGLKKVNSQNTICSKVKNPYIINGQKFLNKCQALEKKQI